MGYTQEEYDEMMREYYPDPNGGPIFDPEKLEAAIVSEEQRGKLVESGWIEESGVIVPPTWDSTPPDAHVQCWLPIDNPYAGKSNPIELALSETTEAAIMEDMKMKGEWNSYVDMQVADKMRSKVAAGYKPIELGDILHERGSVPHFMGNPVASWEDVERIEKACRDFATGTRISYHDACSAAADLLSRAAADLLSRAHRIEWQADRINMVIKELAHAAQVAQEKAIFGGKVSARAARRSAQSTSFTQTLKKSLNEQKGK